MDALVSQLPACTDVAKLEEVLISISALNFKECEQSIKQTCYNALSLLDPVLLSNAKIRRRVKRLTESMHSAEFEDPNHKIIVQLRGANTSGALEVVLNAYKLEIPNIENSTINLKESFKLLSDELASAIKSCETANKILKRRVSRLIFVIESQIINPIPKVIKPIGSVVVTDNIDVKPPNANIKDIKNLDNSTKKRKNNQIEEVANTSTEENSSNKVINKSDIDKSNDSIVNNVIVINSVEDILALVKDYCNKQSTVMNNNEENKLTITKDTDITTSTCTNNIFDYYTLHQIFDYIIQLVIKADSMLTSQKRRLLRRALDRLSMKDYESYSTVDSASKMNNPNHTLPLLLLKHKDLMEYLQSGIAETILQTNYYPNVLQTAEEAALSNKKSKRMKSVNTKYSVFIGQLSYYTVDTQLKQHIASELSKELKCAVEDIKLDVRLLTDKDDPSKTKENQSIDTLNENMVEVQEKLELAIPSKKDTQNAEEGKKPIIKSKGLPTIRNCRGMAFVDFYSESDQALCIKLLHHKGFNGRIINVEIVKNLKSKKNNSNKIITTNTK